MASLGQRLQEARERQGLSLEDAEASTRIRKAYLLALENEEYATLPHPTYVKGFLKSYASYLGLDTREVLDLYPDKDLHPAMVPVVRPERPRRGAGFWGSVATLPLLLLGLLFYLYSLDPTSWASTILRASATLPTQEPPSIMPPASATAPTLAAMPLRTPSPSPTPVPQQVEVRARAIAKSWVAVNVDSTPTFTGTLEPGQERTWVGRDKVSMRVGNAGGLVIAHNGQERGVLGGNGQVMDVQWTRDSMSFEINPPPPPSPR